MRMKCVECGEFMERDEDGWMLLGLDKPICWRCMNRGMGRKMTKKRRKENERRNR